MLSTVNAMKLDEAMEMAYPRKYREHIIIVRRYSTWSRTNYRI
jgi:hypothetical protein